MDMIDFITSCLYFLLTVHSQEVETHWSQTVRRLHSVCFSELFKVSVEKTPAM